MAKDSRHYDAKAPRFKSWMTPPEFFKKLDEEFHFTLDAAASHENALCEMYCTIDGVFIGPGSVPELTPTVINIGEGENGLTHDWVGHHVFCNPPYDASISQWVDKAFRFEAEVAVLLLPPSFDTAWGQKIWKEHTEYRGIQYKDQPHSVEIRLPPGRLRFLRPAFKNPKSNLKDYEVYGEAIFDYSKPPVPGDAPRAGNLVAVFRR